MKEKNKIASAAQSSTSVASLTINTHNLPPRGSFETNVPKSTKNRKTHGANKFMMPNAASGLTALATARRTTIRQPAVSNSTSLMSLKSSSASTSIVKNARTTGANGLPSVCKRPIQKTITIASSTDENRRSSRSVSKGNATRKLQSMNTQLITVSNQEANSCQAKAAESHRQYYTAKTLQNNYHHLNDNRQQVESLSDHKEKLQPLQQSTNQLNVVASATGSGVKQQQNNYVIESDDDDDDDIDCLVANETLQVSANKKRRRLTSPPVEIRKITKRRNSGAFNHNNKNNSNSIQNQSNKTARNSACSGNRQNLQILAQQSSSTNHQQQTKKITKAPSTTTVTQQKKQLILASETTETTSKVQKGGFGNQALTGGANKPPKRQNDSEQMFFTASQRDNISKKPPKKSADGIMSRNSPVQDEMSVNSAIKANTKLPAIRVVKQETRGAGVVAAGGTAKPPMTFEKENANTALVHHHTVTLHNEHDATIVVSGAAMVLPDTAILKAFQQNNQVTNGILPQSTSSVLKEVSYKPSADAFDKKLGVTSPDAGTFHSIQSTTAMQKHQQFTQHGRHFSVNLPYASKAGLHTNMSTLQVSKKAAQQSYGVPVGNTSSIQPQQQTRVIRRTSTTATSHAILNNAASVAYATSSGINFQGSNQSALQVYGQPISADCVHQVAQPTLNTSLNPQPHQNKFEDESINERMNSCTISNEVVAGTTVDETLTSTAAVVNVHNHNYSSQQPPQNSHALQQSSVVEKIISNNSKDDYEEVYEDDFIEKTQEELELEEEEFLVAEQFSGASSASLLTRQAIEMESAAAADQTPPSIPNRASFTDLDRQQFVLVAPPTNGAGHSQQDSSNQEKHQMLHDQGLIYIEQSEEELIDLCVGGGGNNNELKQAQCCPENISSEEEEPELGLGELLEEHRAHFFMEKLSGNFSTNDLQESISGGAAGLSSSHNLQVIEGCSNQQNKGNSVTILNEQKQQLKQAKSSSTSGDMLMQSCSAASGDQFGSLQGGTTTVQNQVEDCIGSKGTAGAHCSSTSIAMKSSEDEAGYSYQQFDGGADGDSKMKSLEEASGGVLDSERDVDEDESSTSYPQIQADARNDFQKANQVVAHHAAAIQSDCNELQLRATVELENQYQQQQKCENDYRESNLVVNTATDLVEGDSNGILHADAEDDLRMIQEQLRQFNDVSINERQSIIKDHLEASATRQEQSSSLMKQCCESDQTLDYQRLSSFQEQQQQQQHQEHNQQQQYHFGVEISKIQERFEDVLCLKQDPELDNAMANALKSKSDNNISELVDYGKGLIEPPEVKVEDFSCSMEDQQLCGPAELGQNDYSHSTIRAADQDVQNVRFESSQKASRVCTRQIALGQDIIQHQNVSDHSSGLFHSGKQLIIQHPQKTPVYEFRPLTQEELKIQKHGFDQEFYEKMLLKEFDGRLHMDYFNWQNKIDKLMRVTLLCWMAELCSDMRFQKTTFYMSLAYCDKFFEQVQKIYGPEDLQLIGVTAVFLAAKVEEVFVPTVKIFSKSTNYSSSVRRICQMEREMMSALRFRLHPITLINWADWFTRQWDEYADANNMHALTEVHDCAFRQFTLHSYNRYRTFMTYLDAVAIDFKAHEFGPRQLIAALLYLVIGNEQTMAVFPNYYQMAVQFTIDPPIAQEQQASSQQDKNSNNQQYETPLGTSCGGKRRRAAVQQDSNGQYLKNNSASSNPTAPSQPTKIQDPQTLYYNDKVFEPFLIQYSNMKLHEIRDAVMYVSKFLAINLELDPPDCTGLGDDPEDVKIEEYIGLQTANTNMLSYLDWIVKHEEQQRRQQQQAVAVQNHQKQSETSDTTRRGRKAEAKTATAHGKVSHNRRTTVTGGTVQQHAAVASQQQH